VLVDMSTIDVALRSALHVASRIITRNFVDAPVSGSVGRDARQLGRARRGTLRSVERVRRSRRPLKRISTRAESDRAKP